MDVEQARADWISVRDQYCAFANLLQARLNDIARSLGIFAEISARAKETHSLVKKLLKKQHLTYETLPDKVGARIVVRYRSELEPITKALQNSFVFKKVDDTSSRLGQDRVGYLSIHMDSVALLPDDPEIGTYPAEAFFGEIQLRTLGQHLWSEISHDTFYKNDELVHKLPQDLQRRVNLAAGLVEVADREFDRMNAEAKPSPEIELYSGLEKLYYGVASRRPDIELSLEVIHHVLPLYGKLSAQEILQRHIVPHFEANRKSFETIYANPENNNDRASAFLFQPEAFLLYDRLLEDRDQLLLKWNERFPERELDLVATALGFALE